MVLTSDIEASHLFKYIAEFEVLRKQCGQSVISFSYGETHDEKIRLLQKLANIYEGYQFAFTVNDSGFVYKSKAA